MSLNGVNKRPVHACLRCRNRKIKCGREKPECRQCQQHGHRCSYEPDLNLDDELPSNIRTALVHNDQKTNDLSQRVETLEVAVRSLLAKGDRPGPPDLVAPSSESNSIVESASKPGYLQEDDGEYRYIGSTAWNHFIPKGETSSLMDGVAADASPVPFSTILFAPVDPGFDSNHWLPSSGMIKELWDMYKERVDPMCRILHKPTFQARLVDLVGQHQIATPSEKGSLYGSDYGEGNHFAFLSLFFAFIYAAIKSLLHCEVTSFQQTALNQGLELGPAFGKRIHHKEELMQRFLYASQQNLMKSKLLNRPRQDAIMALCLLIFTKYTEADRDTSLYICMGILVRCGRTYGLHIDPTLLQEDSTPFSPIDIETRRRLWHQILHLDGMVCEPTGIEPEPLCDSEIWPTGSMTQLPSDISDDNLTASTDLINSPPAGKNSDMAIQVVRYHASLCIRYISGVARFRFPPQITRQKVEAAIEAAVKKADEIRTEVSGDDFLSMATRTLASIIEDKLWLVWFDRFERVKEARSWNPTRKKVLSKTVDLLEVYNRMRRHVASYKFAWHFKRHSQLHAVLHILDELCRTDPFNVDAETFEICRHAWTVVKVQPIEDEDLQTKRVWNFITRLKEQAGLRWSTGSADATMVPVSGSAAQQNFDPVDFAALANHDGLDYFTLFQDLDASFNVDMF